MSRCMAALWALACSMQPALEPCSPPRALTSGAVQAEGKPRFELGEDEMEIGIGIHGEPGRRRAKLTPALEITEMLTAPIVEDLGLKAGDQVLAMVNGMGGTPLIELYIVFDALHRILHGKRITIARNLIVDYITSLDMAALCCDS